MTKSEFLLDLENELIKNGIFLINLRTDIPKSLSPKASERPKMWQNSTGILKFRQEKGKRYFRVFPLSFLICSTVSSVFLWAHGKSSERLFPFLLPRLPSGCFAVRIFPLLISLSKCLMRQNLFSEYHLSLLRRSLFPKRYIFSVLYVSFQSLISVSAAI